jgi:hypothetical protein
MMRLESPCQNSGAIKMTNVNAHFWGSARASRALFGALAEKPFATTEKFAKARARALP